jgi:nicotinamidase/pyrazinamidase
MVLAIEKALILVDLQPDFMPESEGQRIGLSGAGTLGVENGEKIVPKANIMTRAFRRYMYPILTTQDNHPEETAHFSPTPDYVKTWPKHCVAGTPGAMLHPDLLVARQPDIAMRFLKGTEACETPEEDNSYSGANAVNPETDIALPDWLRARKIKKAYVLGLAIGDGDGEKLCVDSTAIDLHEQGFEVTLITDAVEAVNPANRQKCFENLGKMGIRLMTMSQVLEEIDYEE